MSKQPSRRRIKSWLFDVRTIFFFFNGIKELRSNATPQCPKNHRGVTSNRDSLMSDFFFFFSFSIMASRSLDLMWLLNVWITIEESHQIVTPWCLTFFFITPIMASRSHDLMQLLNSWTRFLFGHRGVALDCDSPMPLLKKNCSDIMESRSNATPWCLNQVFVETLKTT